MFNPAGGLIYHSRALLHRHRWARFRYGITEWLASWPHSKKQLLLVGPSAGYTLNEEFLFEHERLIVAEPDRLARKLFQKKMGPLKVDFIDTDLFSTDGERYSIRPLWDWIAANPDTPILFCNVLGQLPLLYDRSTSAQREAWQMEFRAALAPLQWASFHDRLSMEGRASSQPDLKTPVENHATDKELALRFLSNGKIISHETESLFPETKAKYLIWPLTKTKTHVIECTHHEWTRGTSP